MAECRGQLLKEQKARHALMLRKERLEGEVIRLRGLQECEARSRRAQVRGCGGEEGEGARELEREREREREGVQGSGRASRACESEGERVRDGDGGKRGAGRERTLRVREGG